MTKNVPNFVKNMGTKICDFLSERKFTKYSENSGDSLWLVTKISLDLVKILGIHQIWWRICHQQSTGSYMVFGGSPIRVSPNGGYELL